MTICAKCKHCRPNYELFNGDHLALEWSRCARRPIAEAYDTTDLVTGEVTHYMAEYQRCKYVNVNGDCPDYEQGTPPSRPVPDPELVAAVLSSRYTIWNLWGLLSE
jgi:hypothetical protein